jgi:hypothetical protein
MPFEFIQIPANGQGSAKEELNKLLLGGRIASMRKEFVAHGEDTFWAFCEPQLYQQPGELEHHQPQVPGGPQLRPQLPDGCSTSMGLNRPQSRSFPQPGGDKSKNRPSGAGSSAGAGSKAPYGQFYSPHFYQP